MKKITAQVHYDEILDEGNGIYFWLNLDELSTIQLLRLVKTAPFKTKDCTELHCTIMFCKEHLPVSLAAPEDAEYCATLLGIDHWIDHKGRNILVFRFDSPELQNLHEQLATAGLQHSYPEFNPHISLAKDIAWNAEQRLWVDEFNQRNADNPLVVHFSPQLRAAPIS